MLQDSIEQIETFVI